MLTDNFSEVDIARAAVDTNAAAEQHIGVARPVNDDVVGPAGGWTALSGVLEERSAEQAPCGPGQQPTGVDVPRLL